MGEIRQLLVVDEYSGEYFINESYRPVADKLKQKFDELKYVPVNNILFVDRQETKQKHGSKLIYAQISKIPTRWEEIIYQLTGRQFAYMIEVFKTNIYHMSRAQVVALLYHEMRHIQLVPGKNGPEIKLVGHDIEDWSQMIEKLGVDWGSEHNTIPDLLDDRITDWDAIEGPLTLFEEANLRVVK